ncbi:MAG TPA: PHB depolymerase family esterase [Pirellulales bacterium]|jgi:polyhydroxybutyrate depolymerase|nr:PHB depolymerase family esterase [Pirellulales bacterium]
MKMIYGIGAVVVLVVVAIAVFLPTRNASADPNSRDPKFELVHDKLTRTYELHLPPSYDGKTPLPVVLNLHGGGGNATAHRRQTQMDVAADKYGFIVVYPEGTAFLGRMYTWNAGSCCGYAVNHKIDDVGFISKVIDDVKSRYAIDETRVYATGMSNGAMLAYRLACELSNRITAICAVSGEMGGDFGKPQRPVPILHIHGLKDQNAAFNGGIGANAISKIEHRPVRDVIKWWCAVDHCDDKPTKVEKTADYIHEIYTPRAGEDGAPIELYMLLEGGHTWPGGVDVTPKLGTGKLIATFDADATMWEFFKKFSLPKHAAPEKK